MQPTINETIIGLFTSTPKPLGSMGMLSAIRKDRVAEIQLLKQHIPGDDVANKKYHGGPKRVLHHYSLANYAKLKEKFPELADRFLPGTYGENLTTANLSESDLCIGDIFQLGTARIQLTIPRSPCSTIDMTYESKGILKEIVRSGHFGWFYQILVEGVVTSQDHLVLTARPFPELNLHRLIMTVFHTFSEQDRAFLEQALATQILDDNWNNKIKKLLA